MFFFLSFFLLLTDGIRIQSLFVLEQNEDIRLKELGLQNHMAFNPPPSSSPFTHFSLITGHQIDASSEVN